VAAPIEAPPIETCLSDGIVWDRAVGGNPKNPKMQAHVSTTKYCWAQFCFMALWRILSRMLPPHKTQFLCANNFPEGHTEA
jgi:hypothetical protein